MNKIIGLGNALVDVLVMLDDDKLLDDIGLPRGSMQLINSKKFLELDQIISTKNPSIATGGSAANTIKALATLNAPVGFIGKIGVDSYGEFFKDTFTSHKIETHLLLDDLNSSGVASTFISKDGERTFGTYLGAASNLLKKDITSDFYNGFSILYVEGYLVQNHDLILKAVKLAKDLNLKVCIDLASYNIVSGDLEFFHYLVENYVDIVFANEEEAYAFSQKKDAMDAVQYIGALCDIAVVKIGAKGSLVMRNGIITQVDAVPNCKVVDTTGAGDYFAAGFLYGYINNQSLENCAKIGSILSANVIADVGTTLDEKVWKSIKVEIENILNK